jgi:TolB-like protein/Flp pilus assembly protein TadD
VTTSPDIFLSYTREDQATAQRFAEAFQAQGFFVWWDATLRSGEAYDQVTEEALRTAKAVVVLWSKKSVTSRWVRAEATLADRNRTLVPARIEVCDLPIMFELTQTADLCRWTGKAQDPAWRAFLADVRRFVESRTEPQRPVSGVMTQAAPKPPAQSPRASLAVLPFINRSGVAQDDVFADGLVEDLTAALSGSYWMRVVASSATSAYRTGARDLRQIGRDLGARYLLEGNVRRVGDNLRVTSQLVEAETGDILWTQKFDRPLAEVSALQDDLVADVAAHLRGQVERAEMEHALRNPGNISAWEAALRANLHSSYATRAGTEVAAAEARRGVELNPAEGLAYSTLASYQGHLLHLRGGEDPELAQDIAHNIERAHTLAPNSPEVNGGIATALAWMRKPQEALTFAERAVSMYPNNETARLVLGSVLVRLGRSDEAIIELDAINRLSLDSSMARLALRWRSIAHLQAGRFDQALEAAERSLCVLPNSEAAIQSALCLAKLDRWDRARDVVRRLRASDPELSCSLAESLTRDVYCASDAVDDCVAVVRKLWDETSSEPSAD